MTPPKDDDQKPPVTHVADGELFLFVRLNPKTQELQVLFSNFLSALSLHDMAETHLEQLKRQILSPRTAIAVPGMHLPSLEELRKKGS